MKIRKTQKSVFLNACSAFVYNVFLCCSVFWFLYGQCCHGAPKLDIPTKFTTTFLWTSLRFILDLNFKLLNTCDCVFTKIPSGALWLPYMWADTNLCVYKDSIWCALITIYVGWYQPVYLQRFHLVRFDYHICGLITTCADVWGGLLAAVTITKICIVIRRFKMKQRKN